MIIQKILKTTESLNVNDSTKKRISFSQYSKWAKCPRSWKLSYIDKIKVSKPSISLVFGTSFHETLQHYLKVIYTDSVKKANQINLHEMLQEQMMNNYAIDLINNNNEHFATKEQIIEHWKDGCEILDYIVKNRLKYFSTKGMVLVGIELPLYIQAAEKNTNVMYLGYLDLVMYDKDLGKIIIYDIKTSTKGWTDKDKKDKVKTSQVILYKKYFSELLDYPVDKIDVVFWIVRRKVWENPDNPYIKTKRIQEFTPTAGSKTLKDVSNNISLFISNCFNEDGSYNDKAEYPAIKGVDGDNCKWCEFKNHEGCPVSDRITTQVMKK
jgi:hypothetical protein